jgi:hypothetical protein
MSYELPSSRRKTWKRSRTAETDAARRHGVDKRETGSRPGMPLFLSGSSRSVATSFGAILDRDEENESEVEANRLREAANATTNDAAATSEPHSEMALLPAESVGEIAPVSGEGNESHSVAYGLALRGRTDATFSSSFRTLNVRTTPGTGCDGCSGSDCVHVTGTLESTFRVATQVTLPSVSDFPDLTACQRQRVRDAITNVLAPHEQQHVTAFRAYNGVTRTPFDLTLCRTDFDARIQSMHDAAESTRQASAQAASDALDPFEFEVDLDCEDRRSDSSAGQPSDAPVASSEPGETAVETES